MFWNDEIKVSEKRIKDKIPLYLELIHNTLIVTINVEFILKNIYKTLMRQEQLERNRMKVEKTTNINVINLPVCHETAAFFSVA